MQDLIQRRAYALWETEGRPQGQDQSFWFKAVAEIAAETATKIQKPRKRPARQKKAA